MKKFFSMCAFVILLFFTSCTSTKISSFKSPDVKTASFKKLLIVGNLKDIESRKILESDLRDEFKAKGTDAVSYITVIDPLREYTKDELQKIYADNGIDAIVSVSLENSSEKTEYVPTLSYGIIYDDDVVIGMPYVGGYVDSYTKSTFEIVVIDVKTGKTAMKATANTEGDESADTEDIMKSLSKKVVEEYIAE